MSTAALKAAAETSEEKGLRIAQEADKRGNGFGDFTAELQMLLKNRYGEESLRNIRISTLETENDGDKSLSIFDDPRDVKGTAFLTHSHRQGDDDQWLFMPALKRVKRISSRNKSGSFMGSEFAYEDISSQEVEKYTYSYLRDEEYDGSSCFVLERYPVDKENSGYSKQIVWLDQTEFRTLKVEYYDRKDSLLKTLTLNGYALYLDRFWQPGTMEMLNHQNGKSTLLTWKNYSYRTGLHDGDFHQNALERVK